MNLSMEQIAKSYRKYVFNQNELLVMDSHGVVRQRFGLTRLLSVADRNAAIMQKVVRQRALEYKPLIDRLITILKSIPADDDGEPSDSEQKIIEALLFIEKDLASYQNLWKQSFPHLREQINQEFNSARKCIMNVGFRGAK